MIPSQKQSTLLATVAGLTMLLSLSMHATQAHAQETRITASITPSYYSGTYGTNTRTDIFYLPLNFLARTGNLTLKATIPYIRVHSQGAIIAGGAVVGTGGQARTTSGLGDIWLEARYRIRLNNQGTSVAPYVKVKLGTASKSKGLGTGANDYEFGGRFITRIGRRVYPFAQIGYRILGSSAGLALNNFMTYRVGVSYVVDARNIGTLLYDGHQSSQPGLAAASELIGAWNYRIRRDSDLQAFALLGLSSGSPDYGGGISYLYHF